MVFSRNYGVVTLTRGCCHLDALDARATNRIVCAREDVAGGIRQFERDIHTALAGEHHEFRGREQRN
jgi:hypothetical protein